MNDLKEVHWPRSERERLGLELRMERRELRTTQKWMAGYRRLALAGWLAFLGALLAHPSAKAEALPEHSMACVCVDGGIPKMATT